MKYSGIFSSPHHRVVTPFTGVWIEMDLLVHQSKNYAVTPFTGVWIEILMHIGIHGHKHVTPFTGVWIEIQCR